MLGSGHASCLGLRDHCVASITPIMTASVGGALPRQSAPPTAAYVLCHRLYSGQADHFLTCPPPPEARALIVISLIEAIKAYWRRSNRENLYRIFANIIFQQHLCVPNNCNKLCFFGIAICRYNATYTLIR